MSSISRVSVSHAECPPPDSDDANGVVFRCFKNDPPRERDMQTAEEQGRLLGADPCMRRAISTFRSQEDAEHQARLFRRWKRRFIAKAVLSAEHGKIKATGEPTHTSWWPSANLTQSDRAALFRVICEVKL